MSLTLALSVLLTLAPIGPPAAAGAGADEPDRNSTGIQILLDTSGSMSDPDNSGAAKIEGAKTGIISLVNTLPAGTNVGLSTYPSGGQDCGTAGQVIGFSPLNPGTFTTTVAGLARPDGGTPTADALRTTAADLDQAGASAATIVLVSDGESNCGADPCEVARELVTTGHRITINTVGFDISDQGRQQLQCIADAASGQYYDVSDAKSLGEALESAARPAIRMSLNYPTETIPVDTRSIDVSATVRVDNGVAAVGVQVSLSPDIVSSDQALAVSAPVRSLGTIGDQVSTRTVTWSLVPNQTSANASITLKITVRAANSPPATQTVTLRFGDRGPGQVGPASTFYGMKKALVLGDSFSSGEGADDTAAPYADLSRENEKCHRTRNQYAGWLFEEVKILACSGAVTDNLSSVGQHGERSQLAQLKSLLDQGYRPDVVFLTISGNDLGFGDIVKGCVLSNIAQAVRMAANWTGAGRILNWSLNLIEVFSGKDLTDFCRVSPQSPLYDAQRDLTRAVMSGLPYVYESVGRVFSAQSVRIPPIVVLPYPVLTPLNADTRRTCMPSLLEFQNAALGLEQIDQFLRFQLEVNTLISDAVTQANKDGTPVHFAADVAYALQPDHSLCSAQPWLNPITAGGAASGSPELVHPNKAGHQAMAIELLRWSQSSGLKLDGVDAPATAPSTTPDTRLVHQSVAISPQTTGTTDLRYGTADLQLSGFPAGSQLVVVAHSTPVQLGGGTVGPDGTATVSVRIDPERVPVGTHELVFYALHDGKLSTVTVPLRISEAAPPFVEWSLYGGAGSMLLGLGALGVLGVRRRRRAKQ